MGVAVNPERHLTAHDIAHFRKLELTMRTKPYAVSGTEAADAIASLLHEIARLRAAQQKEHA